MFARGALRGAWVEVHLGLGLALGCGLGLGLAGSLEWRRVGQFRLFLCWEPGTIPSVGIGFAQGGYWILDAGYWTTYLCGGGILWHPYSARPGLGGDIARLGERAEAYTSAAEEKK
jgi:hypothetical protein